MQRSKPSSRIAQFDSLHGPHIIMRGFRPLLTLKIAGYLTFVLEGLRRLWPEFDQELHTAGGL